NVGRVRYLPIVMNRRQFLVGLVAAPIMSRQSDSSRFVGVLPLGNPAGLNTTPLGRLLGRSLDARLFTDISVLDAHRPETLITSNDHFYVRTAAPQLAPGRPATIDASLERLAAKTGPFVMECAGNSDPMNFGLMSAAEWEGIPVHAI